jgi:HEPN domain-containing protein
MLKGGRYIYVGYLCHQTIEKTLKGIFVQKKKEIPPYTHKLMFLIEKIGIIHLFDEEKLQFIDSLEPLQIEARYPSYRDRLFSLLTEVYCKELLKKTGELNSWLKKI